MPPYMATGILQHILVSFGMCDRRFLGQLHFQFAKIPFPVLGIMTLAIINGLLTSILLETCILSRQMKLRLAFKTAIGMSLISMIAMGNNEHQCGLNEAILTWWVIPFMLIAGFVLRSYNYCAKSAWEHVTKN